MENSYGSSRKSKDVSLKELSDRLAEFAQVRGWDQYHSPRNLLLALVGEVGELSEIFQWKGEVARDYPTGVLMIRSIWKKSSLMFCSILFVLLMFVALILAKLR